MRVYKLQRLPAWRSLELARALPRLLATTQHTVRCPECASTITVFDRINGKRLPEQLACTCGARWSATKAERSTVASCWRERQRITGAVARACLPRRTAHEGLLPTVHDVDGWLALGITDAVSGRPAALSPADPSPHVQAYLRGHLLACLSLYSIPSEHFDMPPKAATSPIAPAQPADHFEHDSLAAALVAAEAEARSLARDGHNKHNNFHYATADQVFDIGRQLLSRHGLAWSRMSHTLQGPALTVVDIGNQVYVGDVTITWKLRHDASDETDEGSATYPVIAAKNRPHDKAVGASVTYGSGQIMLGLLCWDREDEHNAINRRGDGDSNSPAEKARGKGNKKSAEHFDEADREPEAPKPPADPYLTDADKSSAIIGRIRDLAVLEGVEPGDVWRGLLERAAIPTVIRNAQGSEIKVDTPKKLRVSQAAKLAALLDADLERAHAFAQAAAAGEVAPA